jgi:hypothetical protein
MRARVATWCLIAWAAAHAGNAIAAGASARGECRQACGAERQACRRAAAGTRGPALRDAKHFCARQRVACRRCCRTGAADATCVAPSVTITDPAPARISGVVSHAGGSDRRIVGWARTDRWYAQETSVSPGPDGSFAFATRPWARVAALLVGPTYRLPSLPSIDYHPGTDPGVLAWAETPPSPTLSFAGATWRAKHSAPSPVGPGPCVFHEQNATVVAAGALHLRTEARDGVWTCGEAVLDGPRGYGVYTFQVADGVDRLDRNTVLGLFLYETDTREIDVECSAVLTGFASGCQFVVQPFHTPGNRVVFRVPAGVGLTHRIAWHAGRVDFLTWKGFAPYPPPFADLVYGWTHTGQDVPPAGALRTRANLWLFLGQAPAAGASQDVALRGFTFVPE